MSKEYDDGKMKITHKQEQKIVRISIPMDENKFFETITEHDGVFKIKLSNYLSDNVSKLLRLCRDRRGENG